MYQLIMYKILQDEQIRPHGNKFQYMTQATLKEMATCVTSHIKGDGYMLQTSWLWLSNYRDKHTTL